MSTQLVDLPDSNLEPMIARHSDAQNLDPKLVRALIQAESGYNVKAVSNKGAIGLMQLMPDTASALNILNPYDPDQNIRGGTMYLRQMLDHFAGKVELAIAAYNAGPGAVEKHRGIPPFAETREYVKRVLALWRGAAEINLPTAAAILLPDQPPQALPDPRRQQPSRPHHLPGRLAVGLRISGLRLSGRVA